MDQQIVGYLQNNKDNYTKESLVMQLKDAGHDDEAIQEAVAHVYGANKIANAVPSHLEQQPIQGGVHYAGFWIRWVAILIDGLVLMIPNLIIYFGMLAIAPQGVWIAQIIIFLGMLLYFALMTNKYQATLGKMAVGVKVCDAQTMEKAESGHIWMREFINRLFLTLPFLVLLEIVAAFTQRKQGLHDMAAKTVVVYKDPNKKMSKGVIAVVVVIAAFILIAIIGILASIVLVSLNSARDAAKGASAKSTISSTVPTAILCMDDGFNLSAPIAGTPVCRNAVGIWPDLIDDEWGIVVDGDVSDGTFEYTAIYANGSEQATCTELGCEFTDSTY